MATAIPRKIDPRNRVVLPPQAMDALNLAPGEYVGLEVREDHLVIYKMEMKPVGRKR